MACKRRSILLGVSVLGLVLIPRAASADDREALAAARAFPDGGGYDSTWKGNGVPEDVVFKGETILSKAGSPNGSYCCGFTFAVVMRAAAKKKLIADKTVEQIGRFQKEWYGATKGSKEKQCALAVQKLGIGREVALKDAQPGDFMMFWRPNGSGHSVVFLGWVRQGRRRVGIRYRSSQASTRGIGDRIEHFAGVKGKKGTISPSRTYVARLHRR